MDIVPEAAWIIGASKALQVREPFVTHGFPHIPQLPPAEPADQALDAVGALTPSTRYPKFVSRGQDPDTNFGYQRVLGSILNLVPLIDQKFLAPIYNSPVSEFLIGGTRG